MDDMLRNLPRYRATALNTALSRVFFTFLLAAVALPAEARIYRWVDAQGKVHYSDTLPVRDAGRGNDVLSKDGVVMHHHDSEAQKKAQEAAAAAERVQQEVKLKQQRRDQALLATYTTPQEIDLARDRALENYKLMNRGAEIRAKAVEANLADLRSRIASIQQSGRKVGHNLQEQLDQATREREELQRTIQNNETSMEQVREKYAADKARFRELTGK